MTKKHSSTIALIWTAEIILLFLCNGCLPFNYFPSSKISVHDVFGTPLGKISVVTADRTAMYVQMEGYSESYSQPLALTTNENGECEIPWRFRFAMPIVNAVSVTVNRGFPGAQKNDLYDSTGVLVDKGKDLHFILRPIDIDYRLCNSIPIEQNRLSCLAYSSFFSAVREGDPNICINYSFAGVNRQQSYLSDNMGLIRSWESMDFRNRKDACIVMVALRTNNKNICDRLDIERPYGIDKHTDRMSKCLAEFEDPDAAGLIGTSNEELRRFICTGHDWRQREQKHRQYLGSALDDGIYLYRRTCQEPSSSSSSPPKTN